VALHDHPGTAAAGGTAAAMLAVRSTGPRCAQTANNATAATVAVQRALVTTNPLPRYDALLAATIGRPTHPCVT
jgi:hypothetical protein